MESAKWSIWRGTRPTVGTVQMMSNQGSHQEELSAGGKPLLRPTQAQDPPEEATSLGDLSKPRWSIGIGKRDDCEGRTKEVTLTRGSRCHYLG